MKKEKITINIRFTGGDFDRLNGGLSVELDENFDIINIKNWGYKCDISELEYIIDDAKSAYMDDINNLISSLIFEGELHRIQDIRKIIKINNIFTTPFEYKALNGSIWNVNLVGGKAND